MVIIVLVKCVPDMSRMRFDVDRGRVDRSSADLDLYPDKKMWELMRGIKAAFDSNNILSLGIGVL